MSLPKVVTRSPQQEKKRPSNLPTVCSASNCIAERLQSFYHFKIKTKLVEKDNFGVGVRRRRRKRTTKIALKGIANILRPKEHLRKSFERTTNTIRKREEKAKSELPRRSRRHTKGSRKLFRNVVNDRVKDQVSFVLPRNGLEGCN